MKIAVLAACIALLVGGCQAKAPEETKTDTAEAQPQDGAKTAAAPGAAEEDGEPLPTAEDFEEEVAETITDDSDLDNELDSLEKEIGD